MRTLQKLFILIYTVYIFFNLLMIIPTLHYNDHIYYIYIFFLKGNFFFLSYAYHSKYAYKYDI